MKLRAFACIFLALVAAAQAQSSDLVAAKNIPHLRSLATPDNYALLGFATLAEVRATTINFAYIEVRQVRLDHLTKYTKEKTPTSLLQPADIRIYPLVVKGQTRSSIMLGNYHGNWEIVAFGYPTLAKLLTAARAQHSALTRLPQQQFFAVQVRALNAIFLAYDERGILMLVPLYNDPSLDIEAGPARPAHDVLLSLVPMAKQQDPNLPR